MVLLVGTLPSSCFPFFLPIASSFALPIFGISDTATEVIPALYAVTDMVTYVRLALQDLTTQKAPVLFQLPLKSGCFLRDPPNQWQETAIPCGTAVTSAGLLPCC